MRLVTTAQLLTVAVAASAGFANGDGQGEPSMTRETVKAYFANLQSGAGWESSLADDMVFTSFASPNRQVNGKAPYLTATSRFYSMIRSVELRELLVEGDRAVALTRYELQPPNGLPAFSSDVAERFTVRSGRISSFGIYFDTSPYPR